MYNSIKAKAKQVKATEVYKDEFENIINAFLNELDKEIETGTRLNINVKVEYVENVN